MEDPSLHRPVPTRTTITTADVTHPSTASAAAASVVAVVGEAGRASSLPTIPSELACSTRTLLAASPTTAWEATAATILQQPIVVAAVGRARRSWIPTAS